MVQSHSHSHSHSHLHIRIFTIPSSKPPNSKRPYHYLVVIFTKIYFPAQNSTMNFFYLFCACVCCYGMIVFCLHTVYTECRRSVYFHIISIEWNILHFTFYTQSANLHKCECWYTCMSITNIRNSKTSPIYDLSNS